METGTSLVRPNGTKRRTERRDHLSVTPGPTVPGATSIPQTHGSSHETRILYDEEVQVVGVECLQYHSYRASRPRRCPLSSLGSEYEYKIPLHVTCVFGDDLVHHCTRFLFSSPSTLRSVPTTVTCLLSPSRRDLSPVSLCQYFLGLTRDACDLSRGTLWDFVRAGQVSCHSPAHPTPTSVRTPGAGPEPEPETHSSSQFPQLVSAEYVLQSTFPSEPSLTCLVSGASAATVDPR